MVETAIALEQSLLETADAIAPICPYLKLKNSRKGRRGISSTIEAPELVRRLLNGSYSNRL